jgi:hypothetical protein
VVEILWSQFPCIGESLPTVNSVWGVDILLSRINCLQSSFRNGAAVGRLQLCCLLERFALLAQSSGSFWWRLPGVASMMPEVIVATKWNICLQSQRLNAGQLFQGRLDCGMLERACCQSVLRVCILHGVRWIFVRSALLRSSVVMGQWSLPHDYSPTCHLYAGNVRLTVSEMSMVYSAADSLEWKVISPWLMMRISV